MKKILFAFLALTVSISFAQNEIILEKTDCFLEDCGLLERHSNLEFGKLTVPENYNYPNGRKIKIAFAIIKAVEEPIQNNPVIIFQGGWGATTLELTEGYIRSFPVKNRDVILFDYRGSGYSEPKLCDWLGEATWNDIGNDLTNDQFEANQTIRFNQCLDSLELRKIDFNQYGSNTKTKDAVMLAEQLGYESYNLLGISYGTRAIQNFIRNADDSSVKIRSAVLDSNSPMGNFMSQGRLGEDYVEVLHRFLKDCESDPDCNAAFPDLKNRFSKFLIELDTNPWVLNMADGTTFTLNRQDINGQLFQMLYVRRYYKNIPLMLEEIMSRNGETFELLINNIKRRVTSNFNGLGMVNFVYDHKAMTSTAEAYFKKKEKELYPFNSISGYMDFYFKDQRIGTDSLESVPVVSDIPSLFFAGEYDPITPPSWTKEVAKGFENHYYFEVKRYGHGVAPSECGKEVLLSFLSNPNQQPTSECIQNLGENKVNFVTSYYKNAKISKLASGVFQMKNIPLLIGLILVVLFALVNSIKGLRSWLVKKDNRSAFLTVASIGILVFLVGLFLAISKTASGNAFLLAFGLGDSANKLFYLVPIILGFVFLALIRWFKSDKTLWSSLSAISLIAFIAIALVYHLYPNF